MSAARRRIGAGLVAAAVTVVAMLGSATTSAATTSSATTSSATTSAATASGSSAATTTQAEPAPGPLARLDRPGPLGRGGAEADRAPGTRRGDGSIPRRDALAAADLPEVSGQCPPGQALTATYAQVGFEDGQVPHPDYSVGWTVGAPASGAAPEGRLVATTRSVEGETTDNVINPIFSSANPSAGLYVSLTYRGSFEPGEVGLYVNDASGALTPSTQWRTVTVDASASADFGVVEVFVDLVTGASSTVRSVEIDEVRAWACAPVPATGVRGDWTGDSVVDLLGLTSDGDLYVYPGRGTGAVSSGVRSGSGWSIYNWVGSPGDVNGDRRSDLVARDDDGRLYAYSGVGMGAFRARVQVGYGWGAMTAFATPTDMDLDGRPELLARRADSTLHLYSFNTSGSLRYRKQVGTGWDGMSWIIGMGDLNGDRRGDTVGVNQGNACLYAYITTSSLALGSARQVGCGWGSMTFLASPGDLNRDGLGDLLARAADGGLWFYPGKAGGGVRSGTKVGSGWGSMAAIL